MPMTGIRHSVVTCRELLALCRRSSPMVRFFRGSRLRSLELGLFGAGLFAFAYGPCCLSGCIVVEACQNPATPSCFLFLCIGVREVGTWRRLNLRARCERAERSCFDRYLDLLVYRFSAERDCGLPM